MGLHPTKEYFTDLKSHSLPIEMSGGDCHPGGVNPMYGNMLFQSLPCFVCLEPSVKKHTKLVFGTSSNSTALDGTGVFLFQAFLHLKNRINTWIPFNFPPLKQSSSSFHHNKKTFLKTVTHHNKILLQLLFLSHVFWFTFRNNHNLSSPTISQNHPPKTSGWVGFPEVMKIWNLDGFSSFLGGLIGFK